MADLDTLNQADIGDFEKLMAVTTVMTQSVISFFMAGNLPVGQQFFLGGIYEAVKFSASAFIFGILFSTIRTHPQARLRDYPRFMRNRWHVLFVPSILWTAVYLLDPAPRSNKFHHYDQTPFPTSGILALSPKLFLYRDQCSLLALAFELGWHALRIPGFPRPRSHRKLVPHRDRRFLSFLDLWGRWYFAQAVLLSVNSSGWSFSCHHQFLWLCPVEMDHAPTTHR